MAIPIPNFSDLANQQGQINQNAANQQTLANRPNQSNQYGSLTWTQGPNGQWTQNQTLNGQQQGIFDAASGGQQNLAGMVGQGVNANGLANWGDAGSLLNGVSGMPDGGFGASQQVIDAVKGIQQPGLTQARDAERARLAAMGITLGSDASNNSERVLGNTQNDADLKAILAGTQEYGNVFNRQLAQRQQGVSENEKTFNMAQALRGAQGQERINMNQSNQSGLQALAGTKASTNPNFASFTGATALPPPNQYQAGLDTYNAHLAQQNANQARSANRTAGIAGLAGSALSGMGGIGGLMNGVRGIGGVVGGLFDGWGGDAISGMDATGWDGNWNAGEDFLGGGGGWGTGDDWGNMDFGSFF